MKADPILVEGAVVRGYRVVRQLGAGGMGAVFEAEEATIGRRVALKALLPELASDERNATRFEREAKSMSLVRHPSVIDVFAYGKLEDGRPYFVMPLLSGRSLREELSRRGAFTPTDAWKLLRDVASGLAAAHKAGVLHRDLKPENVFVATYDDGEERAILLDFGIAKWTEDASDPSAESAPNLTATGAPIGTPVYMAPEQWWSQPCTPATDQYAFGVVLFELLGGRPPFFSTKYPELLAAHLHEKPPSLLERNVEISDEMQTAVERLLAKDGTDRFADMPAAITALDAAFGWSKSRESERGTVRTDELAPSARGASEELSTAKTLLADPNESTSDAPRASSQAASGTDASMSSGGGWRQLLGAALALAAFGLVGYAGVARHDVGEWFVMSGFGGPLAVLLALVALAANMLLGRRTAPERRSLLAAFALALLPAFGAALSTLGGWTRVVQNVEASSPDAGFMILHLGRYELGAGDFIGLGLSSALFFGLLLRHARRSGARSVDTRGAEDARAAWSLRAIGIAMALSAGVVSWAGAPSAMFLMLVAGAALVLLAEVTDRDVREPAVAAALGAVLTARGAAVGRADAHAASAWMPENTRAERALAVTVADLDRTATSGAAWIVLLVVLVLSAWLLLRPTRGSGDRKFGVFVVALALLVVALVPEFMVERAFKERRRAMAQSLSEQFTLYSELSPPLAGEATLPAPEVASALQITRDRVAVNGREVGRLAALDSPSGRQTIAAAMIHALARPSALTDARHVDLSCTFDERVPWSRIEEVLSIAYEGGARDVDVLFTRGDPFELPHGAPPEAASVLPLDFGALPVTLAEAGYAPPPDAAFVTVAGELLTRWDGATPIEIRVKPRR